MEAAQLGKAVLMLTWFCRHIHMEACLKGVMESLASHIYTSVDLNDVVM